jgi:hypothetical protein
MEGVMNFLSIMAIVGKIVLFYFADGFVVLFVIEILDFLTTKKIKHFKKEKRGGSKIFSYIIVAIWPCVIYALLIGTEEK